MTETITTNRPSTDTAVAIDLRDKPYLDHEDVVGLNFIRPAGGYLFRRHFRQGLRSHVMEMLLADDVRIERRGTLIDGIRRFPKATPVRIFRLFRTRLKTLDSALQEIARVKMVEAYLAPDGLARSTEFVVDYAGPAGYDILLCGLQEYVTGEILNPWSLLGRETLAAALYDSLRQATGAAETDRRQWVARARRKGQRFVERIKRMITESGHVPDLAGVGNLIMNPAGDIKLVDINNIARVPSNAAIDLDDKGYPVCDKSIEALAMIEEKLLGHPINRSDPIYRVFLDPERMRAAKELERRFQHRIEAASRQ